MTTTVCLNSSWALGLSFVCSLYPFQSEDHSLLTRPVFCDICYYFAVRPSQCTYAFVLLYKQLKTAFCCPWQIFSLWSGFNPPDNILAALFTLALHYVFSRPFGVNAPLCSTLKKEEKEHSFHVISFIYLENNRRGLCQHFKIGLFSLEKYLVVELLF